MLIGPTAMPAHRSAIATTLTIPPRTLHEMSASVHTPPRSGSAMPSATRPASADTAVTTMERSRRAARTPRKSAEP